MTAGWDPVASEAAGGVAAMGEAELAEDPPHADRMMSDTAPRATSGRETCNGNSSSWTREPAARDRARRNVREQAECRPSEPVARPRVNQPQRTVA